MNTEQNEYEKNILSFHLNMRILVDALERDLLYPRFYQGGEDQNLSGVRLYYEGAELNRSYVYIVEASEVSDQITCSRNQSFIIIGNVPVNLIPEQSCCVTVLDTYDRMHLFEMIQDVIEKYRLWDWKLQMALSSDRPLDDILLASMEIFRNPMFIHDSNFFILSDPRHHKDMTSWERDRRTNREIVPISLINDFRTDMEYIHGLKSHKPVLYSAEQTGYRILYRNIWNGDRYEGRILVDEIRNSIQPGDFYALEYLAQVLEFCIRKRHLVWMSIGNDLENYLRRCVSGDKMDDRQMLEYLAYLHWNRLERYVCLRIETDQMAFHLVSADALLGQIETQLPSGKAFYMENSICVIANLSYHHESTAEVISKLAVIMRESLLKIGISSEIHDFSLIDKAYRQACIALEFGRAGSSTSWYYYFDDYMLDYIVDCATREIPLPMLCTDSLYRLRKYDEENNAELYHTLEVYLRLEKNVLRTAKELFIHRSTLSYRLERIQKIINVNLDDPKERLKLQISFFMESGREMHD